MYIGYLATPFLAWLVAGSLKFLINSVKSKALAFNLIGYGGLPSNHSAIVVSVVTLIALREGVGSGAFGVALALLWIVVLDASSLRRKIGQHAEVINKLASEAEDVDFRLRERMGHTWLEIVSGMLVGAAIGGLVYGLPQWLDWFFSNSL